MPCVLSLFEGKTIFLKFFWPGNCINSTWVIIPDGIWKHQSQLFEFCSHVLFENKSTVNTPFWTFIWNKKIIKKGGGRGGRVGVRKKEVDIRRIECHIIVQVWRIEGANLWFQGNIKINQWFSKIQESIYNFWQFRGSIYIFLIIQALIIVFDKLEVNLQFLMNKE